MRSLLFALLLGACGASAVRSSLPVHGYAYRQATGHGWAEGRYQYRQRHGRWRFFDERGRKTLEGEYRYGVMHGMWTFFFEDGQVLAVRYRDGIALRPVQTTRQARTAAR